MAVPKGKISKSKRGSRRSQYARRTETPTTSKCAHCGEVKMPHRVCVHCGYYKGKEIIAIDEFSGS